MKSTAWKCLSSPASVGGLVAGLMVLTVGCQHHRRDVGRVERNVGPGYSEIYPRTGVQPLQGSVLNGPLTTPTAVSQGSRLEVAGPPIGAQVPVVAVNDGIPAGAISPPPIDARPFPQPVPTTPIVAAPAPAPVLVPVAPVVAMPTPVIAANPIPVSFESPATRSAFIPAGGSVPMAGPPIASGPVPSSIVPQPVPVVGGGGFSGGPFLSDQGVGGFRLRPRAASEVSAPSPAARPAAPTTSPRVPSDRPRIERSAPPTSSRPDAGNPAPPRPPAGTSPGSGPSVPGPPKRLDPPEAPADDDSLGIPQDLLPPIPSDDNP